MKRIFFYKPLSVIISVFLFSLIFTACKKQTTDITASEEIATAKAGKPSGLADVFLKVTIDNTSGYNLTSDGGGDYTNGLQSVGARFDGSGNFIFNCGLGGRGSNTYMIRWFNFDFSQPIQIFVTPPVSSSEKALGITTVPAATFPAYTPLQSLAVGQSECVGLTGGISGNNWTVNFHRAGEDVPDSPSAYAVFTRVSSTQWTVAPVGPCSPNSNVCALRNGPGTLYGYYNMPFSLTLTKL